MDIYLEIFGYVGTALVLLSMTMTSLTKLRIVNMAGSVISAIYAALCNTWPVVLLNVGMNGIAQYTPANLMYLLSDATQMAMNAWARAAEVTCDRAGMICCNNLEDAYSGEAKFMYGGAFGKHEVNYKEVLKQLEQQNKISPSEIQ